MKKLVYTFEVSRYLSEEEQELTFEELHEKHFEHFYAHFGNIKDLSIHDGTPTWVNATGVELRDETEEEQKSGRRQQWFE